MMSDVVHFARMPETFLRLIFYFLLYIFQGGTTQMRFQPRQGKYLAAAGENLISILDVETQAIYSSLQVIFLDFPIFIIYSSG